MSRRCPCTQVCDGVIVTTGCIYSAIWSPVFFGAPFGALVADPLNTMTLAFGIWVLALVYGLQRLCVGIAQNIKDGHGANVPWALLWMAAAAYCLHVCPDFLRDTGELARLAARGFCVSVIAGNAANLVMAFIANWRSRAAIRRMRAQLLFALDTGQRAAPDPPSGLRNGPAQSKPYRK
jgi:hypothetical protein